MCDLVVYMSQCEKLTSQGSVYRCGLVSVDEDLVIDAQTIDM